MGKVTRWLTAKVGLKQRYEQSVVLGVVTANSMISFRKKCETYIQERKIVEIRNQIFSVIVVFTSNLSYHCVTPV